MTWKISKIINFIHGHPPTPAAGKFAFSLSGIKRRFAPSLGAGGTGAQPDLYPRTQDGNLRMARAPAGHARERALRGYAAAYHHQPEAPFTGTSQGCGYFIHKNIFPMTLR
jgi:hypothetical protein